MGFLYIIQNTVNEKVYVGITTTALDTRWKAHKMAATRGQTSKLYRAMRKHGVDQFSIKLVEIYATWEELVQAEIATIAQLNSFHNGYNSTLGGDGTKGCLPTNEQKMRISGTLKGRKDSLETRSKKSEIAIKNGNIPPSSIGCKRVFTEAHCANLRKRVITEQHRKRISNAIKLHWETRRGTM